jgi:hypothetical protein
LLTVAHYEHPFFEVHIPPAKGKGFASTEPCAKAQPNQRFEPSIIYGCPSSPLAHLTMRIDSSKQLVDLLRKEVFRLGFAAARLAHFTERIVLQESRLLCPIEEHPHMTVPSLSGCRGYFRIMNMGFDVFRGQVPELDLRRATVPCPRPELCLILVQSSISDGILPCIEEPINRLWEGHMLSLPSSIPRIELAIIVCLFEFPEFAACCPLGLPLYVQWPTLFVRFPIAGVEVSVIATVDLSGARHKAIGCFE